LWPITDKNRPLLFGRYCGQSGHAEFVIACERLEVEARRLAALTGDGPAASAQRKQVVSDVGGLRRAGEMNAYIDLLFLSLVMVLCISKIVTD